MTEKKPYAAPKLVNHGTVADLTKTNLFTANASSDGGSFPAAYAS